MPPEGSTPDATWNEGQIPDGGWRLKVGSSPPAHSSGPPIDGPKTWYALQKCGRLRNRACRESHNKEGARRKSGGDSFHSAETSPRVRRRNLGQIQPD
jgi:hypothetical protein